MSTRLDNWSEHGYPGGPMVKVAGFPRPVYPPDAASKGKQPSVDGPDVEAYKRTVSRAGRWPWKPYDQAFNNPFSHGRAGGNIADSGVAGVQAQQHLDATGWVGEKTFNTLRSIRIPEGLPHAGEPAMDATAARLIDEAWELFGGAEPAPAAPTVRAAALELAAGQLGYTESPAGSNRNKFGAWYGMDGQPWCAMFCTWAYLQADTSKSFVRGSRWAYCPFIVGDARAKRYGLITTDDPIPGDLVVYNWSRWDTIYDHVGLFEKWVDPGVFHAVEGNTASSSSGDQSNGGGVYRKTRSRSGQGTVFIRVAE